MKHVLENDEWSVEINEKGAELSSVQKKAEGREYIWQGVTRASRRGSRT